MALKLSCLQTFFDFDFQANFNLPLGCFKLYKFASKYEYYSFVLNEYCFAKCSCVKLLNESSSRFATMGINKLVHF